MPTPSLWVHGYEEVFRLSYKYADAVSFANILMEFNSYEGAVEHAISLQLEEFVVAKVYKKKG